MTIDQLLSIIGCPVCHGALTLTDGHLHCPKCAVNYEIKDEIPVLIPQSHS